MGTNLYHHEKPPCPQCGHVTTPRHIGKSSAGWAFQLHVYPDIGIDKFSDWVSRIKCGGVIKDEYGHVLELEDFERFVLQRRGPLLHTKDVEGRPPVVRYPTYDCICWDFS